MFLISFERGTFLLDTRRNDHYLALAVVIAHKKESPAVPAYIIDHDKISCKPSGTR